MPQIGRHIAVIGSSGAGKSYTARKLSEQLSIHYINIDTLHWLPNWTDRPVEEKRRILLEQVQRDGWVIDGFTSNLRAALEPKLETVIWLDLPFHFVFPRLIGRTLKRCLTKERVCNDNVELLWQQFVPSRSLWVFAYRTFWSRRRDYEDYLKRNPQIQVFRVRKRSEINALLAELVLAKQFS